MKPIRILGGGISGLTAAINLKIAGFDIEVHERKSNCGKNTNDFQFKVHSGSTLKLTSHIWATICQDLTPEDITARFIL